MYQALWQEYTLWHRFCAVSRERWIGKRWNVGTMGTSDRKWRESEREKKDRKWNGNKAWIIRSASAVARWALISFGGAIVCGTVVTIISHFCHRTLSVFTSALWGDREREGKVARCFTGCCLPPLRVCGTEDLRSERSEPINLKSSTTNTQPPCAAMKGILH